MSKTQGKIHHFNEKRISEIKVGEKRSMENPETFTGELYVCLLIHVEVQKSVAMKGACCYASVAFLVLLHCCKNGCLSPSNTFLT